MAKNGKAASFETSTKITLHYVVDLGQMSPLEQERLVSSGGVAAPSSMMGFLGFFNEEGMLASGRPVMAVLYLSQLSMENPDGEPTVLTLRELNGYSAS